MIGAWARKLEAPTGSSMDPIHLYLLEPKGIHHLNASIKKIVTCPLWQHIPVMPTHKRLGKEESSTRLYSEIVSRKNNNKGMLS